MKSIERSMGLDIGGSGVKAALVDTLTGQLVSERIRFKTPQPATPEAVLETAERIRARLDWRGPVGCGFPGSLRRGRITAAPNLDPSWVGVDVAAALRERLGVEKVALGNDADAAGLAEMRLGSGRGVQGTVVVVTFGTGIGTAVFTEGVLVPGTELGHIEVDGKDAEIMAADSARKREGWSWKRWARHVDRYLARLEYLLRVDLFILGGGASKKGHKFLPRFESVGCEVVLASMGNLAGIVGAALFVSEDGLHTD